MTRILYVEDEGLLAIAMEAAMLRRGYTVDLAFDGEEGLAHGQRQQPEVIVTDFMMPRMDGMTMVQRLRDVGVGAPVIVTTAIPEEDFDPELREKFDVYVGKPFAEERLIAALRGLGFA
ncbi:MAG TPA: response regulator [Alphaproteobacteria bacterium]|nr:response regulator [Alphaproteobacteria bacterium]